MAKLTRFAPSPTGYLHLGHAYAAQQAFTFGDCLLRIENIDHTRCKPDYTDGIFEDLSWLGFNWPQPVRIQSQHREDYDKVIESLYDRGFAYRCFKTRAELPEGLYRGKEDPMETKRLERGEAFAWRISMTRVTYALARKTLTYEERGVNAGLKTVNLSELGDEVLARKDIGTSYHVACCNDDALQGITDIVRGVDMAPLTPFQRVLQELMDWPVPTYYHHSLIRGHDGEKLSKRNKDTTIRSLRAQGLTPRQVLSKTIAI